MIQLPEEVKIISENDHQLNFALTPLHPGYGVTIGNALRRVLLSSIGGAAITTVKIKDVSHEFSVIPGVLEDVIQIILNVKRLRLKMFTDDPVILTINASGAKTITGKDIKAPSNIEIISKDQHIATITDKKTTLEIELTAERGIGYMPVEQRQKEKISVGTIAVDAIFSPITNVNFAVENIRVGQRTDYNKLVMDISTDGTIAPREALLKAVELLNDNFRVLSDAFVGEKIDEPTDEEESELVDENNEAKPKLKAKKKK